MSCTDIDLTDLTPHTQILHGAAVLWPLQAGGVPCDLPGLPQWPPGLRLPASLPHLPLRLQHVRGLTQHQVGSRGVVLYNTLKDLSIDGLFTFQLLLLAARVQGSLWAFPESDGPAGDSHQHPLDISR